jgi:Domain of unknown function (DUF3291)
MAEHHLAQLNIARLRAPIDSPEVADFVALLPEVNGLAERSPGYVWRLQDESGDATALRPFEPDVIVNLTVWQSVESLRGFVYRTAHLEPMRRRRDWFVPADEAYLVLWWIPAGVLPTIAEAAERLDLLRRKGPSPEAFTLREPYRRTLAEVQAAARPATVVGRPPQEPIGERAPWAPTDQPKTWRESASSA